MVEDPITKARFLKEDAAAKLEHNGRTFYFASDATLGQYKEKHQLTADAANASKPKPAGAAVASKPIAK